MNELAIFADEANVTCENCVIKDFATAVAIRKSTSASLHLSNSIISSTTTGIECNDGSSITLKGRPTLCQKKLSFLF